MLCLCIKHQKTNLRSGHKLLHTWSMKTSKSTLTVERMALETAKKAVPYYSHIKSPRKFTQPQLLACLIVKELRGLDYRGVHVILSEWAVLRQIFGLRHTPNFYLRFAFSLFPPAQTGLRETVRCESLLAPTRLFWVACGRNGFFFTFPFSLFIPLIL